MSKNSAGSCKYVMQDCRAFTDYSPNCQMEEYLRSKYAPGSSSEYRLFLQRNAINVMKELREMNGFQSPTDCNCNYDHAPHDRNSMARYQYQPSVGYLANKQAKFMEPIMAPNGKWQKYC